MSAKKPVTVETRAVGMSTQQFKGSGMILVAFTHLGVRYMRSRTGGWWECPGKHGEDVMAFLENRGINVQVVL
jgi:hypothetical protein